MKQLLLVVFFTLQTIISSVTLAWSPLDSVEYATESRQLCHSVIEVAASEEDQNSSEEGEDDDEEEEEPDCD